MKILGPTGCEGKKWGWNSNSYAPSPGPILLLSLWQLRSLVKFTISHNHTLRIKKVLRLLVSLNVTSLKGPSLTTHVRAGLSFHCLSPFHRFSFPYSIFYQMTMVCLFVYWSSWPIISTSWGLGCFYSLCIPRGLKEGLSHRIDPK